MKKRSAVFGILNSFRADQTDFMPKTLLTGLLLLTAAFVAAVPAVAAESGPAATSAYRLNIGPTDAFRRAIPSSHVPPLAPRAEPAIPAALAGKPFAAQILNAARDAALDPALVHAVIFVESRYDSAARSPKGAIGLMQVMPDTALRYGVPDPGRTPEANLKAGTRYLSDLMQQFGGRLDLVLAAYNAGERAVVRYGKRIPPYRETQHYVPAVLAKYSEWQEPPSPVSPAGPGYIEYLPGTRLELRRP